MKKSLMVCTVLVLATIFSTSSSFSQIPTETEPKSVQIWADGKLLETLTDFKHNTGNDREWPRAEPRKDDRIVRIQRQTFEIEAKILDKNGIVIAHVIDEFYELFENAKPNRIGLLRLNGRVVGLKSGIEDQRNHVILGIKYVDASLGETELEAIKKIDFRK